MKTRYLLYIATVSLIGGCRGPEGPQGPVGPSAIDELTNPNVKPKVIWTFPSNGQVGPISNLGDDILVRFNKLLDASTVNQSIQITPLHPWFARIDTNDTRVITGDMIDIDIDADSLYWNIGQMYTITILTTLKDIHGNTLQSPYSFSFTPEPYFRVTYVYPRNGSTGVSRYTDIDIEFNSFLNTTIGSVVSISPPVSGSWSSYSRIYHYFSPSTELSANTTYVVTVTTAAIDWQGRSLQSAYTFSFKTGQ
jgi:hypothetical protein